MTTTNRLPRHDVSGRHHLGPLLLIHVRASVMLWALIFWAFGTVVG
jgi:hypothetical protein